MLTPNVPMLQIPPSVHLLPTLINANIQTAIPRHPLSPTTLPAIGPPAKQRRHDQPTEEQLRSAVNQVLAGVSERQVAEMTSIGRKLLHR